MLALGVCVEREKGRRGRGEGREESDQVCFDPFHMSSRSKRRFAK